MTNLEKLDTLPELQKALVQVTKERDWARDDVRHEQARASNALARAEQAERERDEARRISRDMGAIISETMEALEGEPSDNMIGLARARVADLKRAEADNAALTDDMRRMTGNEKWAKARPGAALLEYVRALETWVRTAAQGYRNLVEVGALKGGYAATAEQLAKDGLDALKGKP